MNGTVVSLQSAMEAAVLALGIGMAMKFPVGGVEVPVNFTMLFLESLVETPVPLMLVTMSKDCWSTRQ
jgi:hypothetical protein